MKSIELKIKLKHLAEEARIIRREADAQYRAGNYQKGNELTEHRKRVVRPAARATLLAYQYLRGIPYHRCEQDPKTDPNWAEVKRMARKYGQTEIDPDVWVKGNTEAAA